MLSPASNPLTGADELIRYKVLLDVRGTALIGKFRAFGLTLRPGTEGIGLVVAIEIYVLQYLVDVSG